MCIELFELFGVSFLFVMLLMTCLWGVCCMYHNVGVVDIGWAGSFFLVGIVCFIFGDGDFSKKLLMTLLILLWSGRMGWHLLQRFDLRIEDPRYTVIMEKFGDDLGDFKAFLMFLFQGFLVIILSLPFVLVCGYSEQPWHYYEGIGLILWLIGFYGETVADTQLDSFKKNPENKGKVCQKGLWNYSRHPNYFFEWVIWIGFFFMTLPVTGGFFAILSPAIMLVLLTRVSGIPPAEAQALKSKGEAYKEYQSTTSSFVPWFRYVSHT